MSTYLLPKKQVSSEETICCISCVEADTQVLRNIVSWLESKNIALTLNLELGYVPVWKTDTSDSANALKIFLGIWYGRYDEERSARAAATRTKDLGFCLGILPVESSDHLEVEGDDAEGNSRFMRLIVVIIMVSTTDYSVLELNNEAALKSLAKAIRFARPC